MGKLVTISSRGDFKNTTKFLNYVSGGKYLEKKLDSYARRGVEELKNATPIDTGKTSGSWSYQIEHDKNHAKITWCNDNIVDGVPVVILIQYGHATRGGGYVQGIDFINPALKDVFNDLANEIWKEVIDA